ncbi:MAG: hypothetical protein UR25_C0006G0005 [Candidatus Nomurabacteria bacterium GW2011_GWE1_32_28]|uniref:Uncharacterized protein n=1 Tax=Candidatus Nomurabacteria bacterium GW2011_GWF1_31_48 TaxID=1618767 RepID=A0A0F9YER4_9BACT|nr:MAG: hypothetical protein UR10_C0006G0006 [Candidatus Nomurabacteria bacterium GW2011_GWF2_30_133]KKP28206.1 MAG: hypothetical protein UR18_C0008G0005 [Candidatus Nomurabacteria bacterium GW2011_GWE2_31_40]KKP29858.1 MAG: hypothetical protein UR19_C0007G0032 [Candidatus Nomurabacteria bacterium GW2011_GWF1_31_48]KKP34507.1 MAG: hypothetical protein UR25_C0006G0005 [Candidatus Nomurabacteria bacterium GW2011_GWE1_32_28]HAS80417.1 hypothetical protein [Candidatus Nomurabacteria bacterium]
MSEELKNITNRVMGQINEGKIKMKPKIYFVIGSIFTFLGLVSSIIVSTFLIGLIRFSLRSNGRMAQYKFDQLLSNFPWWTAVLAILSLIIGIWLIRKYDFSYKIKSIVIISAFILSILLAGYVTDKIGLNDTLLFHNGPMKGMMQNYIRGGELQNNIYKK